MNFFRADHEPVRLPHKTVVVVYANGRLQVLVPNPKSAGPRYLRAALAGVGTEVQGSGPDLGSKFASLDEGLLAFRIMVAAADFIYRGLTEIERDERGVPGDALAFLLERRFWSHHSRKRQRSEPHPMGRLSKAAKGDVVADLLLTFDQVNLSVRLHHRLTTGTPKRPGLGFTALWQVTVHPREWWQVNLTPTLLKELDAVHSHYNLCYGMALPAGDYPWNPQTT